MVYTTYTIKIRTLRVTVALGACAVAGLQCAGTAAAEQKKVVIGGTCDRTGPTQINGVGICPGIQDYYDLVNSKGGIDGYRIKYMEIDHEYKVPQGVEAYERERRDGAVSMMVYGTPQVQALNQKLTEDKIPGTSPGFGIAASGKNSDLQGLCPTYPTLCDAPNDPSALLASLMGYATVSVNMRGTGCSGGAYDYFEDLQLLDGYDVIWTEVLQPYGTNAAASTTLAVFGDLSYWWMGEHLSPRIDTSDQVFFVNDQLAVRFIEEIDFDYMDIAAASALQTAAA